MKNKYKRGNLVITPYHTRFVYGPSDRRNWETISWAFCLIVKEENEKVYVININDSVCRGWIKKEDTIEPDKWDFRGKLY
jgi:hypothetical protein